MRATLEDEAILRAGGYKVEPLDCGLGPVSDAFVLIHPEGHEVSIDGYGISDTRWQAVAEGLYRIKRDEADRQYADGEVWAL